MTSAILNVIKPPCWMNFWLGFTNQSHKRFIDQRLAGLIGTTSDGGQEMLITLNPVHGSNSPGVT